MIQLSYFIAGSQISDLSRYFLQCGTTLLQGGAGANAKGDGSGAIRQGFSLVDAIRSRCIARLDAVLATAVCATCGRAVSCCEADTRVCAPLIAPVFFSSGVKGVCARHFYAFFDNSVCSAQVFVNNFTDDRPAIGIDWPFTLVF